MARAPQDPREIFPDIVADYKNIFGEDLVSVILYGSAASGEYRPGKSDVNFLVVVSEKAIEQIDRAFDAVKKWQKKNVAIPLFLTEGYVETSIDVFPLEYLAFQNKHVLVFGKDILKDLTFDSQLVRLQCEREIKRRLLLLREAFLETAGSARALKEVIRHSVEGFVSLFEGLLYLKGKPIPEEKRDVIRVTCEEFSLDAGVFEKVLDIKEERAKIKDGEITQLFKDYLKQVRELSKRVDALGG